MTEELSAETKRPGWATDLTDKQRRFVDEYLIDLNATQAAIRSGYSPTSAKVTACRMLTNANIAAAIATRQAEIAAKLEVTQESIKAELAKIGFANMQDYMHVGPDGDPYLDFSRLTRDQAAALTEVTVEDFTDGRGENKRNVRRVKFKLSDKRAALVDLGKHLGMFKDRVSLENPNGEHTEPVNTPERQAWIRNLCDRYSPREIEKPPASGVHPLPQRP